MNNLTLSTLTEKSFFGLKSVTSLKLDIPKLMLTKRKCPVAKPAHGPKIEAQMSI